MSDWSSVGTAVEEHGSVKEHLRWDGNNSAQVTMRCPWADRYSVASSMLNLIYPNLTPSIGALAGDFEIVPVPGASTVDSGGKLVYEEALVTVKFDTAQLGNLEEVASGEHEGQLYSETIEEVVKYQKLDPANFRWGSATGALMKEGPDRPLYLCNIKRTLYNMTSVPDAFWTLPGHVNVASYTSVPLGKTFAAETLLFSPGSLTRTMLTSGSKGWQVHVKVGYNPNGWNTFWNKDKAGGEGYDTIFSLKSNAQYKNFPTADFSSLFYG